MKQYALLRFFVSAATLVIVVSGCGFGGGAEGSKANLTLSSVSLDDAGVVANGLDRATVTVQLKNVRGENLAGSDGVVTFEAPSQGVVESVVDNSDGSYTATYRALGPAGTVKLQAFLDGRPFSKTVTVEVQAAENGFYLDTNGATIRCEEDDGAAVGDATGIALDGETLVTYTKRTYDALATLVQTDANYTAAAQSCISGITALNDQDPASVRGLFQEIADFNEPLNHWDTTSIVDMSYAFYNADQFNQPLHHWNTSNVTSMSRMFRYADRFNGRVDTWNTSAVTDMRGMFGDAHLFNQDVSAWNTANVTTMENMFRDGYAFDQDLSRWNTSKVTNMDHMFDDSYRFNQDISGWDTSKVTTMAWMFNDAYRFDQDLSEWNVSNVTTMTYMFSDASSFNADLKRWNTGRVESMENMFEGAILFNADIGDWDVSRVLNMEHMFRNAVSFDRDLSLWDTSRAAAMQSMFDNASSFSHDLSGWCVEDVADIDINYVMDDFAPTAIGLTAAKYPPFGTNDNCS